MGFFFVVFGYLVYFCYCFVYVDGYEFVVFVGEFFDFFQEGY